MIKNSTKLILLRDYILGLTIIFSMLWLGNLISNISGNFLPDSIMGMLLLALSLQLGIIKIHWVDKAANQFVRWMSLLFVPIGVGMVDQLSVLREALLALVITCILATLILLVITGKSYQWIEQKAQQRKSQ